MLKTYTEIIGSELPIYTSKPKNENYVFEEEKSSKLNYELIGYYLYDSKNELYKALYKSI
ncbi:TPA: hypothetical protein OYD78_002417 [Staphylococcus aureus]|uniref:hypothetical protein n=1 Tax=Staphylococcus TaxID=1279 RepID=UPI0005C2056E|nr:hypothetical protein [Staphylococcus aureus]AQR26679.1 hypothetical protein AYM28_15395 [Staphylococcus aureus]AQR53198.1 hypothetical protein AYM37_15395 [Staphylococcus aureus]KIT67604.1 hypothetical protein QP65_00455 [Staphylococcus aureus]MBO8865140.1 hypothetical protein [Staphylococcus aureus]CAC9314793.1 Uncharacterised protein [Staphylococcus aureus]